jgi:hypothetical protein
LTLEYWTDKLSRNVDNVTTKQGLVTSQKSQDLTPQKKPEIPQEGHCSTESVTDKLAVKRSREALYDNTSLFLGAM